MIFVDVLRVVRFRVRGYVYLYYLFYVLYRWYNLVDRGNL